MLSWQPCWLGLVRAALLRSMLWLVCAHWSPLLARPGDHVSAPAGHWCWPQSQWSERRESERQGCSAGTHRPEWVLQWWPQLSPAQTRLLSRNCASSTITLATLILENVVYERGQQGWDCSLICFLFLGISCRGLCTSVIAVSLNYTIDMLVFLMSMLLD